MLRFTTTVDGVQTLDRAFNRLDGFIADLRNFAPAVAAWFYRNEAEQFETEGTVGASGRWAPLSPAYARFKVVAFPGETILRATGHMNESLTSPEALDAIYIPEPDQITIGTQDPKALAHHRGLGRLPSRPVVSHSERQKRELQKDLQRQLVRFTRGLGFEVQEQAA